ncbi:hypothetical protein Trydic_g9591 [Trypoxylus dichotomus]
MIPHYRTPKQHYRMLTRRIVETSAMVYHDQSFAQERCRHEQQEPNGMACHLVENILQVGDNSDMQINYRFVAHCCNTAERRMHSLLDYR